MTGPRRSLSLKLSDIRVYEPQIRARIGTTVDVHPSTRIPNAGRGNRTASCPPGSTPRRTSHTASVCTPSRLPATVETPTEKSCSVFKQIVFRIKQIRNTKLESEEEQAIRRPALLHRVYPLRSNPEPRKSMSLKYEPASEPLHISVKWLFLN